MHMAALSQYEIAVQAGIDDAEIVALKRQCDERSFERREAVDRYRFHLASHQARTMAAGAQKSE